MIQKKSSGQTFTDLSNLHCDLDLEHSNQIFPQDTLAYDAVLSYQVWLLTSGMGIEKSAWGVLSQNGRGPGAN